MWDRQVVLGEGRSLQQQHAEQRWQPWKKEGSSRGSARARGGRRLAVCPQSPSGLCTTTSRTETADAQAVNIISKLVQEKRARGHCNKACQSGNSQNDSRS